MRFVHPVSWCGDSDEDVKQTGLYCCVLCRKLLERLESIEQVVENVQSVNKDLIHLLEAKEQECNDLRALINLSKVYNEPSVSIFQIYSSTGNVFASICIVGSFSHESH